MATLLDQGHAHLAIMEGRLGGLVAGLHTAGVFGWFAGVQLSQFGWLMLVSLVLLPEWGISSREDQPSSAV